MRTGLKIRLKVNIFNHSMAHFVQKCFVVLFVCVCIRMCDKSSFVFPNEQNDDIEKQ